MRMHKVAVSLIITTLIGTPVSGAKPDPELLTPSSPWNVNYADDSCRLSRAFGTGDETTFVIFDRFSPGQNFKLIVAGKRFGAVGNSERAELRFGPGEQAQHVRYFQGDLGKGRPALIFLDSLRVDARADQKPHANYVPPESIGAERIAAVKELILRRPLRHPVRLALGSMRVPFAVLNKCIDDLLIRWGVDPARHATLSRNLAPVGNPGRWITNFDYPQSAAMRGAQGIVEFRLSIDESGKPSACHIQQSTRPPEFDETVCRMMMRRARFTPALDKDGKPVTSFFRSTVTFTM